MDKCVSLGAYPMVKVRVAPEQRHYCADQLVESDRRRGGAVTKR
ncbi:hypothetical protein AXFE_29570 [Acidithrix ferrooxidans]|uniref:Uncharacterized protein n=1 Tax=Acidithrix ferrooxidans TaxID=1280514 RepID=A0A0D8HE04_9ACTN|nr:hypothetical protein AXFE_29570 [Acidithrix ferrooxidans]CAG4933081.1 unnamed protein product [Acidithrix sp. C25]